MDIDLTGWERETPCIHIEMANPYNDKETKPFIRLSYDLSNEFTDGQIATIKSFTNEVNARFPGVKMFVTGTGYVPKKDKEESE